MIKEFININSDKINWANWKAYCEIDKCWLCKFKEPLLIEETVGELKTRRLNPKMLFHLYSTHGIPAEAVTERYLTDIYKNPDDVERYLERYREVLCI
jgi:hypothetical protein